LNTDLTILADDTKTIIMKLMGKRCRKIS